MAETKRILCLANSRRNLGDDDGRCVAGIQLNPDGLGDWVRPVGARPSREVRKDERAYQDGTEPRVLDVIDISLLRHEPRTYQTENWVLDDKGSWVKRGAFRWADLEPLLGDERPLWDVGDSGERKWNDRIQGASASDLRDSLRLIRVPSAIVSVHTGAAPTRPKVRLKFQHAGGGYDLAVTDPEIEKWAAQQGPGDFTLGECALTISLGELFHGYAYKLVAAIIERSKVDASRLSLMTVGHSTHEIEHFLALLKQHHVTAVADVRSVPASQYTPQFNWNPLERELRRIGIKYVFLGAELGARTSDRSCYVDGKVQYHLLAQTELFKAGIERLLKGATSERIAIMCAEQEPLDCHRTILVSHALAQQGADIEHILSDGRLESHDDAMFRLMTLHGQEQEDLFNTPYEERLTKALVKQEEKIAYVEEVHHP